MFSYEKLINYFTYDGLDKLNVNSFTKEEMKRKSKVVISYSITAFILPLLMFVNQVRFRGNQV